MINFKSILGIVGSFLIFLGCALFFPIIVDLIYWEGTWWAFLVSSLSCIIVGLLLFLSFRERNELLIRECFVVVSITWFSMALFGALPYYLLDILPYYSDAIFESMSGLTTTGATVFGGVTPHGFVNPMIENLPHSILFWRSFSQWLGGMGIIVLSIAVLPMFGIGGMQLFQAETPGPTADKLTPRMKETAKFLWSIYLILTVTEIIFLWVHPSMDLFSAVNHAFTTVSTGGFSTKTASIGHFQSSYIEWVIIIFMFLGGINFAIYFVVLRKAYLIRENSELKFYIFFILAATSFIALSLYITDDISLDNAFQKSIFQTISIITSTGYTSTDYQLWSPLPAFLIFLLFFTGGCAGSTSGGIKMIRLKIIFQSVIQQFKSTIHPRAIIITRIGNKPVKKSNVIQISHFICAFILLFIFGAVILTTMGLDIKSAIGASLTSIGNIGPGWGMFGPSENYASAPSGAKWLLSFLMMVGRLEIFTVLILFYLPFWRK